MKKNYIAPSTELLDLASEGLMQQNPTISIGTAASGAGTAHTDNKDFID
jgi:hypothetical protein